MVLWFFQPLLQQSSLLSDEPWTGQKQVKDFIFNTKTRLTSRNYDTYLLSLNIIGLGHNQAIDSESLLNVLVTARITKFVFVQFVIKKKYTHNICVWWLIINKNQFLHCIHHQLLQVSILFHLLSHHPQQILLS